MHMFIRKFYCGALNKYTQFTGSLIGGGFSAVDDDGRVCVEYTTKKNAVEFTGVF